MRKLLIAAVMLLTFSVAAQAALFQVGSTPVTTVSSCGTTELTGKIVFATTSTSSPVLTGTITINYGVPITSVADLLITNAAGVNLVTSNEVRNISTTGPGGELSQGRLVLAITPGANLALPAEINVSGVRVNIAGTAGLTSLSATVTATENAFVGGQTSVVVINSIASAIDSITVTNGQTNISAIIPSVTGAPVVKVTEGFLGAWIPSNNPAQGPMVALTFSGIPAGVTLTFDASVTSTDALGATISTFTLASATGGAPAAGSNVLGSASSPATVYYRLTTAGVNAPVTKEVLNVPVTIGFTVAGPRPLAQGSVTVAADMAPKAESFVPPSTTYVPQYSGTTCQKASTKPVLTIVGANTALLIPYAVSQPTIGYNTGIAIANTTTDPFAAGATKQSGTMTFYFYPQTGTAPAPYTTSATTPGEGLTSGALDSGRIYTVLLSRLLEAAGVTGDFSGYIIVTCAFTNAHGQYFISDFEAFTNGALMLVINPSGRAAPESLGN